jgi:hypothetical protein
MAVVGKITNNSLTNPEYIGIYFCRGKLRGRQKSGSEKGEIYLQRDVRYNHKWRTQLAVNFLTFFRCNPLKSPDSQK